MVYPRLTKRETEIVHLLVNGVPPKEMGRELYIASSSVNTHLKNIKKKLNVSSNTETIAYLINNNLINENVFLSSNSVECKLTHREKEILELIVKGKTSKEIARELFVSDQTVDSHKKNILSKVGVRSMNEIVILHLRKLLNIKLPNDDEFEDGLERPYNLTKRQFQILGKLVSGLSTRQIAESLNLTTHSIESHKGRIFKKLDVRSSKEAILKAINENFYVLQIIREIEFDENHFKAGMSVLSHFGTVLKQKNPENTASVKIEQQGYKIRMIIDYKDGNEKEVIEKTLSDYGQLIIGNIEPQQFFPELDQVIQFEAELQLAAVRYEFEKNRIESNNKIKKLNKKMKSHKKEIKEVTIQRNELRQVIGDFFTKSLQNYSNKDIGQVPLPLKSIFQKDNLHFNESDILDIKYLHQKADFNQLFNRMNQIFEEKLKSHHDSETLNTLNTEFNQIYSQYNSLKSKSLRGILKHDDAQVLQNQISDNILQVINSLKTKK